jgi:hypothetical protein
LDHKANTVDKQCIIDKLEAASDYERGLARLDDTGKAIVKKLREWAGDLVQVAGNKRKRTYNDHLPATHHWLTFDQRFRAREEI